MLVFIDASGDPGRKILNASSNLFVLAMILVEEEITGECETEINALRNSLKLPERYEFHFSDNSAKIRRSFLEVAAALSFECCVIAFDKNSDALWRLLESRQSNLSQHIVGLSCSEMRSRLSNAKVTIDGQRTDRKFRDTLAKELRGVAGEDGQRLVRRVNLEDSKRNDMLQLADYVAGVYNRYLSGKPDGAELQSYIRSKTAALRRFP